MSKFLIIKNFLKKILHPTLAHDNVEDPLGFLRDAEPRALVFKIPLDRFRAEQPSRIVVRLPKIRRHRTGSGVAGEANSRQEEKSPRFDFLFLFEAVTFECEQ
jgi:hypothetical protein